MSALPFSTLTGDTIKTPFGNFTGKKGDGVVQFLGIKYAELPDQLSEPRLKSNYGKSIIDATSYGPQAPGMENGCAFEQAHLIQCSLGSIPNVSMSSIECLNLNITVPLTSSKALLPVMVFIHGGGFVMGANSWPQYDPSRLVKMSTEVGMPVVVVGINYRLGLLGNLASGELREAGYPGNNSLRDQRCALRWVGAHVSGFGGDAGNVTVFGESAGAVCIFHHLASKDQEPLFKRAIGMSGTPLMLKPLSPSVVETSYQQVLKWLELEELSPKERIHRLLTISPEVLQKTPLDIPLTPSLDNDIVPSLPTFSALRSSAVQGRWCKELLIGSCAHDGNVFHMMGLAERAVGIASSLRHSLSATLSKASVDALSEAYAISSSTPDAVAMASVIELATDIAYRLPAMHYARAFSPKAHLYAFNELNPWEGRFKGMSTHMLDAAFLFLNFEDKMEDGAREVGRKLAKDFIGFANGRAGEWEEGETRLYGPSGEESRLEKLSEHGKVDLDELSKAWHDFVAGK